MRRIINPLLDVQESPDMNIINSYRFIPPPYIAYSSIFDGTNDYMLRGAGLTGANDGKLGIFSCYLKIGNTAASNYFICYSTGGRTQIYRTNTKVIAIFLRDIDNNTTLALKSTNTIDSSNGWVHVYATWNLGLSLAYMYINGVDVSNIVEIYNVNSDYTVEDWAIGSLVDGTLKYNGELCEVYLNLTEYLNDPTKFRDVVTGKPISLGPTASLPTNNPPLVYLSNPYTSFETDKSGNNNNFTVTGALTEGTPP